MAIRNIREIGERVLTKVSEVKAVDKKILTLIEDMLDTMYEANEGTGGASGGYFEKNSCNRCKRRRK